MYVLFALATVGCRATAVSEDASDGDTSVAEPDVSDVEETMDSVEQDVEVTPDSLRLFTNEEAQLNIVLEDVNGDPLSGQPVNWMSDNAAVATVDASGVVTAVSPGQATITATSEGESDSTSLEVVQWATIDAGKYFSCAALTDGEAYCWGENDRGELGIGSTGGVFSEPQRVQTTQRFTEISSGFFHNCGLTINQNIYCWGQGGNGALGNGQTSVSNVPVRVTGAYTFVQVSAGINHSCGLDASDNIQCWGINQDGQLGNATSQDSLIPQTVAGGHTWSKVSAGGLHTCGLTAGGEIFCWGANGLGQLGTGNTVPTNSPVAIDSSETFTDLSVGVDHSCATTSSGSVYCWGSNMHGEIGLDSNSATQRNSPVQVSVSGASFESLESGSGFTCAIAGSGEAWCWGFNGQVNFGNGTVEANQFTPVRISGGYSWSSLGGGLQHMCGLNGQVDAYCWGDNDQGESGTGSTSDLNASPTAVNRPTL